MWSTLFFANVIHGMVALVWGAGVRPLAAPRAPAFGFAVLSLCLAMPVAAAALHLLGLDPVGVLGADLALLHVQGWVRLTRVAPPVLPLVAIFLGGTVIVFVFQELGPTLARLRTRRGVARAGDARLAASVERIGARFGAAGAIRTRAPLPAPARLETDARIAALAGLWRSQILVSRGLLEVLDDDELDAVVAHELAHHVRGGNLRMLGLWLVRSAQAHSPAALLLFRQIVEMQELTCDALAARMTGAPAALASALLKSRRAAAPPREPRSAVDAILRRADIELTRQRVTALLDGAPVSDPSALAIMASSLLLGALLWAIA
ncbi:MAG TPA: M48 family metalloprotease [Candidatus Acidoferrum sp.]|nr:M48 family metalloprotease [Candidatus Acidoferrum sp.]